MVKHYGGMVGIKADVQGFCAKLARTSWLFVTFGEQERSRWSRGIMDDDIR
jgi:hypothetical protein